jgi:monoamine oxidase
MAGSPATPAENRGKVCVIMNTRTPEIVIVGAGVAGLAAAAALRAQGRPFLVLEAKGRIGGRAWTTWPAELGRVPFDHGASWLHAAERNPLAALAKAAGWRLLDTERMRQRRLFVGERLATPAEEAAYREAYDAIVASARARAARDPDISLAEALRPYADHPWAPTIAAWEGAIIAAADADVLSLKDWAANSLEGQNLAVPDGLGALVAALLAPRAEDIRLHCPVRLIRWQEPNGAVVLETQHGTLHARAAIITVSTGVLAAGGIVFRPELPALTQEAIHALPMGLLSKVAFRLREPEQPGLPASCAIFRQRRSFAEPAVIFHARPFGRDYVVSFFGGRTAWELAKAGPEAAEDFVRAEWRAFFGASADGWLAPGAVHTEWGTDPDVRGAYCYARPGQAEARARLAQPLAEGRLLFAGEACHMGLGGTVGGAYLSGWKAAEIAAASA